MPRRSDHPPRVRPWLKSALLLLAWAVGGGCRASDIDAPPSTRPEISGTITAIQWERVEGAFQPNPHVLIVAPVNQNGIAPSAALQFSGATILVRSGNGPWHRGSQQDLVVGVQADAWGTMVDTNPALGSAETIAITKP